MAFPPRTWFLGQLVTAADMNADVRDNVNILNLGGVVPTGLIVDWGDLLGTIPSGWNDCDGGGGRPNLHDRIAVGAGNLYAVGATGGGLTSTPSGHTAHVLTQPGHLNHVVGAGTAHADGNGHADPGATTYGLNSSPQHTGQALTAHDAGANHNAIIDSGGPDVHLHTAMATLPPYHARAKMIKASSGLSLTTARTWTTAEVNTAAQLNAELRDNFNFFIANLLSLKTILMWFGSSLTSLPSGWQLCDGTNGTPDLRDKFVVAAGNTYAVAATGGALTSSLAAHSGHAITQPTGHADHTATQAFSHTSATLATTAGGTYMTSVTHTGFAVDSHSAHSGFNLGSHSAHQFGGVSTVAILPPYIALAYIMLTSVPAVTSPKTWTTSEVVQQSEFNTYIRDNENAINAAQVPLGTIGYWSGSLGSIPANYHDCDGTLGLLNLHDLFIVGAGNSYGIWAQGGTTTVTADAHTVHTVSQAGGHTAHVVTQPGAHSTSGTNGPSGFATNYDFMFASSFTHSFTVDGHSAHAFSVDAHSAHAAASILPPYVALGMIQRIT